MLTDVGHLTTYFALALCVYAVVSSALGVKRNDDRLIQSGRTAAGMTFPMMMISCAGLWYALLTNDFSVKYVSEVSSIATPSFFKITALWGSQNGSLLFWSFIMSVFVFFAMMKNWDTDKSLLPYVVITIGLVMAFFLAINLFVANPFTRLNFPPNDGRGLNPLLRHPGMIIHPPVLYAGFTGFIIPFAYCMASLAARRSDNLWLIRSRPWTLIGWAFLTAGLILGGRWAHDVLGWGGYWGWDPVENKSLVPWLIGTAFLHSAMIQEKRGMFKNWNVALMLMTFAAIIWGTAVVRSGVLTSVHAFAASNLGPMFLGFIVAMLSFSFYLWFSRLDLLRSDNKLDSWFSREGIFLIQNVIFLSSALTVFIGTTFPLFSEAVNGTKITVGPPFYNQMVVPQFALLVLLMGVAPLLAWRKASAQAIGRYSAIPLIISVVTMIAIYLAGANQIIALLAFGLCAYTLTQTIFEYVRGARARMKANNESALTAGIHMIQRNQRRYGGYLVHVGVVLLAIGAIGKGFYGTDVVRNVALNDSFSVGRYTLTYRGLQSVACEFDDCATIQAALLVQRDGVSLGGIYPHRDAYGVQQMTSSIADTSGNLFEEVYVVLAAWEGIGETASFLVYVNPLISFIWIGGVVMILGFLVAFGPQAENRVRTAQSKSNTKKLASGAAALALVTAASLLIASPVRAQSPDPNSDDATYHLAKQLNCPTCSGRNLADCPTDTCTQWKNEIRAQLQSGKNSQEVLAYFQERFGPTVMQEPPKQGQLLIIWILPLVGFVALIGGGVLLARRATQTKVATAKATALDDEYVARIEQEVNS